MRPNIKTIRIRALLAEPYTPVFSAKVLELCDYIEAMECAASPPATPPPAAVDYFADGYVD